MMDDRVDKVAKIMGINEEDLKKQIKIVRELGDRFFVELRQAMDNFAKPSNLNACDKFLKRNSDQQLGRAFLIYNALFTHMLMCSERCLSYLFDFDLENKSKEAQDELFATIRRAISETARQVDSQINSTAEIIIENIKKNNSVTH